MIIEGQIDVVFTSNLDELIEMLIVNKENLVVERIEIKVEEIDGKTYKKHLNHFVVRLKQKRPNVFGLVRSDLKLFEPDEPEVLTLEDTNSDRLIDV